MTIVEFLTARLDERRKRYNTTDELYLYEQTESARGPGWFEGECAFPGCQWTTTGGEKVVEEAYYEHLDYAHDRAWVWADIAAKRAIIHQHTDEPHECPEGFLDSAETEAHTGWERECPTLRFIASVDAEHPDYREEWKP